MSADRAKLRVELLDAAVELMGQNGRGGVVRVQGVSMQPTLREGQRLAVEFAPDDLRPGDMLLFRQVDYLVVHRYLGAGRRPDGSRYFRTRGDGLPGFDPPVEVDRVVGRVLAVERDGVWRSVSGRRARVYGRLVAWHDLFWAVGRMACGRVESWLRRLGIRVPLRDGLFALDRSLLRVAHALMFGWVHPEISEPAEARPATGAPPVED